MTEGEVFSSFGSTTYLEPAQLKMEETLRQSDVARIDRYTATGKKKEKKNTSLFHVRASQGFYTTLV